MSDDVVERVARHVVGIECPPADRELPCVEGGCDCLNLVLAFAEAVKQERRHASEEMREQIEKDMWDIFQSKRFAAQRPSIILKVIRNAKIND